MIRTKRNIQWIIIGMGVIALVKIAFVFSPYGMNNVQEAMPLITGFEDDRLVVSTFVPEQETRQISRDVLDKATENPLGYLNKTQNYKLLYNLNQESDIQIFVKKKQRRVSVLVDNIQPRTPIKITYNNKKLLSSTPVDWAGNIKLYNLDIGKVGGNLCVMIGESGNLCHLIQEGGTA